MKDFWGRAWAQGVTWARRAGFVLILAGMGGAALAQSFSFNAVNVEGNLRVADGTILTFAGIERGEALSAGELNDAAQRIRDSGLFESVELEQLTGFLERSLA